MLNFLNRARKRAVIFAFCHGLLGHFHDFRGAAIRLQAVVQTALHAGKRVRRLKACPTEIMKTR
jgi:hypothetical protein